MSSLSVTLGVAARNVLCDAIDAAQSSIDAEFYDIDDAAVITHLNLAATRGVRVRVVLEGDPRRYSRTPSREPNDDDVRGALDRSIDVAVSRAPRPLVHGKAAVIDRSIAFVATANATPTGFGSFGEVLVEDGDVVDVRAVEAAIDDAASGCAPAHSMRSRLGAFFRSPADLRIASEDLSDAHVVAWLIHRARLGRHDRVLVGRQQSKTGAALMTRLANAGVDVRTPREGYMHEKYVDDGCRVYVGSANMTRNGIDEADEIGILADAADFDDGAASLRASFDEMWSTDARPWVGS